MIKPGRCYLAISLWQWWRKRSKNWHWWRKRAIKLDNTRRNCNRNYNSFNTNRIGDQGIQFAEKGKVVQ